MLLKFLGFQQGQYKFQFESLSHNPQGSNILNIRNYENNYGTSDAWSMSCLSRRPSEPAYYIEDFRILILSKQFDRS